MKLLKFSASWCQPCKQLDKLLTEALPEYPDIELVHMPIEDNKDSVSYYGIRSVPTMVMLDEDNTVLRISVGFDANKVKPFLAGT
jgi:thioredoxin 1